MNVENLVSEVVVLVGNFLGSLVGFGGAGCMTNLSGSYRYYFHGRLAYHNCDSKFDNLILIVTYRTRKRAGTTKRDTWQP